MGFYYYTTLASQRIAIQGGNVYLLDDEFTDTLAAGSVDGTLATDGVNLRTVVDTASKLSLAGGKLVATGDGNGDPGIWYPATTRIAGRVLLGTMKNLNAGNNQQWGYDTDQVSLSSETIFYDSGGGTTRIGENNLGTWAMAQDIDYKWAIVLRISGTYYLVKGGAFTDWTLLGVDSTANTATVYPAAVMTRSAADLTTSYIRSPVALYLPTPIAYDTFTRANGALGNSEAAGPDSQAVAALAWNNRVGTTQIATNKASASALVGGLAIATVDTGTIDVVMQGTLTSAGDEVGLVMRYGDADNYVRAEHDGTNMKLIKRVATSETDVISAVVALGAGAVAVTAEGTSFTLYLNNAKVGATSTISDAGLQTGTEQGLFSTNVGNTQDAVLVMPRGTGSEYVDLDQWSGVNP